jgi:hypothetical protein
MVQVDAEQPQAIGASATLDVADLSPGTHNVGLSGLAANCSVAGDNPQTVTITVGDKTSAAFNVVCGATTGALQVSAQTSGPAPDADGYSISLDGTDKGPLDANGSVTLSNLAQGSHVVGLSGVSSNCTIDGDNLQAVTVTAGETATVTFAVTCVEPPPEVGVLRVTTTTGGPNQDGNGYQFAVDAGQAQPIGLNTSATLTNVAVGPHTVVLSDVASNCTVDGGTSKDATVTTGQTTTVNFNITCSLIPPVVGAIHITTSTSGDPVDPDGYTFQVDGGSNHAIGVNDEASLGSIPSGNHRVQLAGVANNCALVSDGSQEISVTAGGTTEVSFVIACSALQPSATRSRITVSPNNIPTGGSSAITVRVRDASDHPIANVPVTISSTGTGNQINPATDNTDADGIASFSFSSNVGEDKIISATAGGVAISETKTIKVFRRSSTITITSDSPDPSPPGEVTVQFTVTGEGGGTPTGTVSIGSDKETNTGCDNVPVQNGSCKITLHVTGTHTLTALYSGDSQFEDDTDNSEKHEVSNAAPVTAADAYNTPVGTPLSVPAETGVLANDSDPNLSTLTASVPSSATANGGTVSMSPDGSFTYTPPTLFIGNDSFTYTASDGGLTADGTVTISVS